MASRSAPRSIADEIEDLKRENAGKLTKKQRQQIVAWFAMGDNATIVCDRVDDEFGISLNRESLFTNYSYRSKECPRHWKKLAARVRRMAERRFAEIPIARKEVRLQRLEFAAKETMTWRVKSVSEWGEVQERKVGTLVQICDAARREIEGDKPGVQINNTIVTSVEGLKQVVARRRARLAAALEKTSGDNGVPAQVGDNGNPD